MSRRRKQRPGDETLIHDESANPAERASALLRLAADGRSDLVPVARSWLTHNDVLLRSEGLSMLFFWHVEEALPTALKMLRDDTDFSVRGMAVSCLSHFLQDNPSLKELILGEFVRQLERDSEPVVQRALYEALLKHIAPDSGYAELPYHFDRDRDVDWALLAPWRSH